MGRACLCVCVRVFVGREETEAACVHFTWINSSIKKVGNISKVRPWCGIRKGARLMCTRLLSSY